MIAETGGTVGDIESQPFLEAIRQMRLSEGSTNTLSIHLTLVPYVSSSGEFKTKPTQHSVKELRSIGLQPDVLVCRSEAQELPEEAREKIALFTNVEERAVISLKDCKSIYEVPLELNAQGLDTFVVERLQLQCNQADLSEWRDVIRLMYQPKGTTKVTMVGKYFDLLDSYKSLVEALIHAGIHAHTTVELDFVDAEELEFNGTAALASSHAVLVPGGFGQRGFEGKIRAAEFARQHNVPYLGICYGLHAAVIEYARNVVGLKGAHSTEVNPETEHPVIGLVSEWMDLDGTVKDQTTNNGNLGGTMRLGAQACHLAEGSLVRQTYQKPVVYERHRHRYEVNSNYVDAIETAGMRISGINKSDNLVEMIELPALDWFVACQFHPEFTSSPRDGHPLFNGFIKAAMTYANSN